MSHYFSKHNNDIKSNPNVIAFRVNNTALTFKTDHGVFSKQGLDRGTKVLLDFLVVNEKIQSILDLGCGYGVIGVYLNITTQKEVTMVDVNQRAVELAIENCKKNNVSNRVLQSDGFENLDDKFDLIVLNPPIRAGKQVIYSLFDQSFEHLNDNGEFWIVMNKKHGALSAINKLESLFGNAEIIGKDKGFYVIKCQKSFD